MTHRGWSISYAAGIWRAIRFGVGMSANSKALLLEMIDNHYQPKTGQPCSCKRGIERDNCPACEGTGQRIDFAAIRARR